jgi:hypothetical protein
MDMFSILETVVMWSAGAAVFWVLFKCFRGDFHAQEPQDPPVD